ncbi:alpha/beta hydrolase family protein [Archangium lipolyticum]|uniref:alpha/beta hydrolase family protein n=1 Tax=Archangium lipolyticum TaxID=2970465 RepID=UPI00214A65E7|nr:alpha/beta hydrolase [Archangium lipolyticum]
MQNQEAHVWTMKKAQIPDTLRMECEPFLAHMKLSGIEWRDIVLALEEVGDDALHDDWNDWHTHWTGIGHDFEGHAIREAARGNRTTQRQAMLKAATCHHLAELMFFDNPEAKFMTRRRVTRIFRQASPLLPYDVRALSIPHGNHKLPAYLLRSHWEEPVPCVLLVNSLSSAKEIELLALARAFLAQGLAVLVFDGPGQGELAGIHRMVIPFEQVVESVLAQAHRLPELDSDRIGICGLAHGGYLAARSAALLPRELKACACISAGYDHDNHLRSSPLVRQEFRYMYGQPNDAAMNRICREELNLRAIPRPTTPLLAIHGKLDSVVPYESCIRLLDWARGDKELISYPEENHTCANRSDDFLPRLGRWMADHLASPRH